MSDYEELDNQEALKLILEDMQDDEVESILRKHSRIGKIMPPKEESNDNEMHVKQELFMVSFIELTILNEYLYNALKHGSKDLMIDSYGKTDSIGRISFNESDFNPIESYWFKGKLNGSDNEFIFQTKIFRDTSQQVITEFYVACNKSISFEKMNDIFKDLKSWAFNTSKYVGGCIKVKVKDGTFRGIEIIKFEDKSTELILNETQEKFIKHFINRIGRGGYARYLLNGVPGSGKTESIREIMRQLKGFSTFIIPDFNTSEDLTTILEACEIFTHGVIIMDDIDLYLGSRDKGGYTQLLGHFLSFFDGVKKRKISLLASTNDKGLVDKAAERPGRFNITLDYTFLTAEQITKVCNIHLPEEYRITEVYEALTSNINGKKADITGAFISNLADNIKEMCDDNEDWKVADVVVLIKELYKGFYMSQVESRNNIGFKTN
jgi:ATPase family associated with various cellular activities (AAA)